ncbi:NlpC/P60 family protein [Pelosinus fermentans]|uniref:NLP/P60 protein n=1 Tax=Pelosinus fermentans B4 TaxID=1149862 RepID=I8RMP1_9FIRM|nr:MULTISPECIES: C40 family peptidase [Pelosinus]EIW20160.1 NLP/P60 protein [Pelosinus fermentans B4]OAM93034.1 NLP/P60 protein [Pelosinus fermentans DSM 17108]SDQ64799.1 NlpC/P60 family protein [Pelosinus fermentans]
MKKWIALLCIGIVFNSTGVVQASPISGYSQFMQSLDSIVAGAVMPIADEQHLAARSSISPMVLPGQAARLLAVASGMLGQSVVWGGASPAQGFDCSGLVQYVYRQGGINLPRTADLQFLVGRSVPPASLQPGDLVYFTTYEPGASHVGIFIGRDKFIHTSFSKGVVAIGDMNDSYFVQRYYGAKRVL